MLYHLVGHYIDIDYVDFTFMLYHLVGHYIDID
jgi:hypothetical protein